MAEGTTAGRVRIRRQWDDWHIAEIPEDRLRHVHWSTVSGGVGKPAPQPFIHGYCNCTDVEGDIAHSCRHGPPPHWIKVCVVKKDNNPEVYRRLLEEAGPKPARERYCNLTQAAELMGTDKEAVKRLVKEHSLSGYDPYRRHYRIARSQLLALAR